MKKKHKQKKQAENKLLEYLSTIARLAQIQHKKQQKMSKECHSKTSMQKYATQK